MLRPALPGRGNGPAATLRCEAMPTGPDALPRTTAVLAEGMREGLHLGAQLYVSRAGTPVADVALGLARPGVAMTPETLMLWFSSTKALVAVAVAQCWERGSSTSTTRLRAT